MAARIKREHAGRPASREYQLDGDVGGRVFIGIGGRTGVGRLRCVGV
jgi:hypothetical protein